MRTLASLATSCLLLSFSYLAYASSIEGDWSGDNCDPYSDGSYYGTYNWVFSGSSVSTYIQFYKKPKCSQPLKKSQQTKGIYEIVGHKLLLHLSHLENHIEYKVTYNKSKNELWLSKNTGHSIHLIKK